MRRGVRLSTCVLMVLTALVVAGCGDGDADPASTPTGSPSPAETASPTTGSADGSASPTPTGSTGEEPADVEAEVAVANGAVVDGVERISIEVGETVALRVTSDVADTVHVHGYDLHASVAPDEPAVVRFTADIPGVFEVELEQRSLLIVELEVAG